MLQTRMRRESRNKALLIMMLTPGEWLLQLNLNPDGTMSKSLSVEVRVIEMIGTI
jgi:hypothetical protein